MGSRLPVRNVGFLGAVALLAGTLGAGMLPAGPVGAGPAPPRSVGVPHVARIAAGGDHTCVVLAAGTVACWGDNGYGELGDDTTVPRNVPVLVCNVNFNTSCAPGSAPHLAGVAAVAAGTDHTCALRADGTVDCWGRNDFGQLGDNQPNGSLTPTPVCAVGITGTCAFSPGQQLTGVIAITAGAYHTCALLAVGTVDCWGLNGLGQVGNNTTTQQPAPVLVLGGLSDVIAITAGQEHTCALLVDGTVRCWGDNFNGQLGVGVPLGLYGTCSGDPCSTMPVNVTGLPNTPVTSIAAGPYHTCALLADGTVRCWGFNVAGELGNNTTTQQPAPVLVLLGGLIGVTAITAGTLHTCALLADGTVKCWGADESGELGIPLSPPTCVGAPCRTTPVDVIGLPSTPGTVSAIAAGEDHTCALLADGTVDCWGDNSIGELGRGTTGGTSPTPMRVDPPFFSTAPGVIAIAAGGPTCALLADGTVKCWGDNVSGDLGNGTLVPSSTPVVVSGLTNAVAITVGGSHPCALLADGTVRCWGRNDSGQLGTGTKIDSPTPTPVCVVPNCTANSGELNNVIAITAGAFHSCALLADGTARCWGSNLMGDLGNGTQMDSPIPVVVSGLTNAVAIKAGFEQSSASLADGTARCWGMSGAGQLGDGSPVTMIATPTPTPTPVCAGGPCTTTNGELQTVKAITTDASHSCALLADGTARCWGVNPNGELGNVPLTDSSIPLVVSGGLTNAAAITAGGLHACALSADGTVDCWGLDHYGELGNNTTTLLPTPTPTPVCAATQTGIPPCTNFLGGVIAITAGGNYTCALLAGDGADVPFEAFHTVYCWGGNDAGQLGNGTLVESSTPVQVQGLGPTGPPHGTSCTTARGTARFSPALPRRGSKTLVKDVFTTNGTLGGCTGSGVASATTKTVSPPSKGSNCTTLGTYTATPTLATETITWNTGKTSTVALTLRAVKSNLADVTISGTVTAGLFKGQHQTMSLVFTMPKGGCVTTALSSETYKNLTTAVIK